MDYRSQIKNVSYKLIVIMCLFALVLTALDFICPILLRNSIESYGTNSFYYFITFVILLYLINLAVKIYSVKFKNWYSVKFKSKQTMIMFKAMESMSYEKLNEKEPTYLVEKINNSVNTLFSYYSDAISNYFVSVLTIVICLVILAFVCYPVAILLLILIPLDLIGFKKLNKKLQDVCVNLQTVCAKNFGVILSVLSKVDMLKNCNTEFVLDNLVGQNVKTIHSENAKVSTYAEMTSSVFVNISSLLNVLIYISISIFLFTNKIQIQDFIFASLLSSLCVNSVNRLINANLNTRDLKSANKFIEEELLANCEQNNFNSCFPIDFNKINFNIKDFGIKDNILIKEGNFEIDKKEIVFISGDSGCGKSSLMKAMLRFYAVNNIKFDNLDISKIDINSLRKNIFYMSQNIPIINASILDNIILGEDYNKKEVIEKLNTLNFLSKFKNLTEGFNTRIYENGANLSGGDKQRIAAARLMLHNPKIIILDEITNSLDKETSTEIIEMILKNNTESTIFIISHDNDLKKYCNKIVEIKNNHINCILS